MSVPQPPSNRPFLPLVLTPQGERPTTPFPSQNAIDAATSRLPSGAGRTVRCA